MSSDCCDDQATVENGETAGTTETAETADADAPTRPPLPDCPHCGDPVLMVVATGPHEGSAVPCGCSVPPGLIERQRDS
ncbi:hypothetical protein [Natrinema salifodinae]|uniref:Small CPxCG-related zinc finger protein n=1 Tax=Natrinema salifodinae TaxID=1202768 RepID=A0A1I0NEA0_9EURY|nr:hypothetical protein [Natrinema salifodinae]SEV99455.1 hypothetical protein SAMN05216285_1620 [Natrinema salifodinae]